MEAGTVDAGEEGTVAGAKREMEFSPQVGESTLERRGSMGMSFLF